MKFAVASAILFVISLFGTIGNGSGGLMKLRKKIKEKNKTIKKLKQRLYGKKKKWTCLLKRSILLRNSK